MSLLPKEQDSTQRINELKQRWLMLVEQIQALYKAYDLSRNKDERDRLREEISPKEAERQHLEADLLRLESELEHKRKDRLMAEARKIALNNAFSEAIAKWKEALKLDPEDRHIVEEIERLEQRRQESEHIDELIRGVTRCLKEIQPIYRSILKWLQQRKVRGSGNDIALDLIECYCVGTLPAEEFQEAWREIETAPEEPSATADLNYPAFAQRIRNGDIVLFLGSDVVSNLAAESPSNQAVVAGLAQQARLGDFVGSLSKIAEYYQITEYGRSSLLANLDGLIGAASPQISLYHRLAKLEGPLTIISASYDILLENAFRAIGKPFLLVSAFIRGTQDYDIGTLLVEYSDRDQPESPCQGEALSGLEPLENGYSLIFKIRGYCGTPHGTRGHYQDNTLTVAEQNYFTFARYVDKLIPDYLITEFARKGLLFLGFSPREWEDRLIASTVLNKRYAGAEAPYLIGEAADAFERAYWESLNVRQRSITLQEFIRNLEAAL